MTRAQGDSSLSIVQYWHSERIPTEIEELIGTFGELNPELDHRVFREAEADEFIGEHFTAREQEAFRSCAVPAMQSDYFRYCAVLALGGIYSDADFRCVRPLRGLIDGTRGGLLFKTEPRGNLVNGFFVFDAPNHPLLRLALDVATANIEKRAAEKVHVVTGPLIFTGLAVLHGFESFDTARETLGQGTARLLEILAEAIGDFERIPEAFETVRISPLDTAMEWIGPPRMMLAYRQTHEHWVNWHRDDRSIFREPGETRPPTSST